MYHLFIESPLPEVVRILEHSIILDEKFHVLAKKRQGVFKDETG